MSLRFEKMPDWTNTCFTCRISVHISRSHTVSTSSDRLSSDPQQNDSTPKRVILNNVQDSASGVYGVRMTVESSRGGSVNSNEFMHQQEMTVGGELDSGTPCQGRTSTTDLIDASRNRCNLVLPGQVASKYMHGEN